MRYSIALDAFGVSWLPVCGNLSELFFHTVVLCIIIYRDLQWRSLRCSLYAGLQQPESTAILPAMRHPTSSTYLRAAKWDRIQSLGYVLRVNWSIKSWLFYLSLRVLSLRLAGLSAGARPLRPSSRCLHCYRALILRPGPLPHREPPQVICYTSLISLSVSFVFSFPHGGFRKDDHHQVDLGDPLAFHCSYVKIGTARK